MTELAVDTGVAVPYVVASHSAHELVRNRVDGERLVLTGHSLAETCNVLTRLPGDARLEAADATALIAANFGEPALLSQETASTLPEKLARFGIIGGAVYDALVGRAASERRLTLVTRDLRARSTYEAVSATVRLVEG